MKLTQFLSFADCFSQNVPRLEELCLSFEPVARVQTPEHVIEMISPQRNNTAEFSRSVVKAIRQLVSRSPKALLDAFSLVVLDLLNCTSTDE